MPTSAAGLPFSFQHLSLAAGVRAAMHRNPAKIACRHGDRTRSYAELMSRIDRVSSALCAGLGLKPGQHGAIIAKNSIEYLEIVIGASQAGIALATVNPRLSAAEMVGICDDAGAAVVFADPDAMAMLRDAKLASAPTLIEIGPALEAWLAQARPSAELPVVNEWDVFTIPYTSGTTGKPKGACWSRIARGYSPCLPWRSSMAATGPTIVSWPLRPCVMAPAWCFRSRPYSSAVMPRSWAGSSRRRCSTVWPVNRSVASLACRRTSMPCWKQVADWRWPAAKVGCVR